MSTSPAVQAIIAHNARVKASIAEYEAKIEELQSTVKAPCKACPYDGDFRCSACADAYYAGFNVRDYPC